MDLFEKNWFEKNPIEIAEIPVAEYVCYFTSFDVGKIFYSLDKINTWSNGVDYIGGSYNSEWNLKGMQIGIYYGYEGKYHIEFLSKQKYLDFLLQLRNQYATEDPEYTALKEGYLNWIKESELYK